MSKSVSNIFIGDGGGEKKTVTPPPITEPPVLVPPPPVNAPYDFDAEMKGAYKHVMAFDNKPAIEIARSAATKSGVNPSLLFSSAYQEGMNKAILDPDSVSEAFYNAEKKGLDTKTFPVDGYYNYGLDTFGDKYQRLKKYLPEGFEKRFKTFDATNEQNSPVKTAAFMTNEDALVAKGAMLRDINDTLAQFAKDKKINIAPEDMDYFTLAAYNGGEGNAKTMLQEYAKAKDKKSFIEKGETTRKGVHKNIIGRLQRMKLAQSLFDEPTN